MKKIIILSSIVVISIISILVIRHFIKEKKIENNNKNYYNTSEALDNNALEYTDSTGAFFLETSEHLNSLYSKDGNLLTQEKFKYVNDFTNGVAAVSNDDNYGIINDKGKFVIEYGKYSHLTDLKGVFLAEKDGEAYLLNSMGKVIKQVSGYDSTDLSCKGIVVLKNENENKYMIITDKGDTLCEFNINEDNDTFEESLTDNELFWYIHYDKSNYLINTREKKLIFNNTDNEQRYFVEGISEDEKGVLISKRDKYGVEVKKIFIFTENSLALEKECDYTSVMYNRNNVKVYDGIGNYLLDKNGNKMDFTKNFDYIDNNHYAINHNDKYSSTDIYANGKIVKNIDQMILKETFSEKQLDYYILSAISGNNIGLDTSTVRLYDKDGNRFNDKEYKEFIVGEDYIEISYDGKTFFLADKSGAPISKGYERIQKNHNFFVVNKNDLTQAIVALDGEELIEGDEINVSGFTERYVILKNKSKKIIFDTEEKRIIWEEELKSFSDVTLWTNYFTVSNNDGEHYYSYITGKSFFIKNN